MRIDAPNASDHPRVGTGRLARGGTPGLVQPGVIPLARVIPTAWLGCTLVRATVISAYPYGVINVIDLG